MDILYVATSVLVCPLSRIIPLYIPPSRPSEYFGILAKNAKSFSACAGLLVALVQRLTPKVPPHAKKRVQMSDIAPPQGLPG